ncbi:putative UDP-glucuronate:xylan alpha-glucuronosyltransferase 3 [Curcuma longa]|uniref:putative UDP-glucuronate:xylan alpha-glucuronosyltransferase 3 n=1 Tax=Curcuma longa TaxID=136217 RepID=UPI003D9DEEFF
MSPISANARQPSTVTEDDTGKTKPRRFKVDEYRTLFTERCSSCKFWFLKLAVLIIICCLALTLAFSSSIYIEQPWHSSYRHQPANVSHLWRKTFADPRYASDSVVNWEKISQITKDIVLGGNPRIGLLNFNCSEVRLWHQTLRQAEFSSLNLDYADANTTWETLYPGWINEGEKNKIPTCPTLPEPEMVKGFTFDLVAVKLPCNRSGRWSRDVARLHLQLAAAKIAEASSRVHVLLVTDCLPLPNLFTCKNLVRHEGNFWLYKPEIASLREKIRLPVGSCELSIPFEAKVRMYTEVGRREAYATVLHSAEHYACGAIAAARSIRASGSVRDLVVLVDEGVTDHDRRGLEAAGWKVKTMQRIRNPKAKRGTYNEWNYSKFRLWQLTDYDRVVFIDSDLLILRNIDFLFALPEVSAAANNADIFNSGLMVLEPSNCTFQLLMDRIQEITSYNGGDQGYLNEIFTWWHRVPRNMNYLKFFTADDRRDTEMAKKNVLFGNDPPALYVIHYLGKKPWICFRDYDCNWNVQSNWRFASDEAHATWWRMHDLLPENLQKYCLLPAKFKAILESDRRQAEKDNYPDGHWRRNITDPRQHI